MHILRISIHSLGVSTVLNSIALYSFFHPQEQRTIIINKIHNGKNYNLKNITLLLPTNPPYSNYENQSNYSDSPISYFA